MDIAFAMLVALVATVGFFGFIRFFPHTPPLRVLALALGWLIYAGVLGYLGVLADVSRRPPGMLFVLLPSTIMLILLAASGWGQKLAIAIPMAGLIALQSFRLPLELFLHSLWVDHQLPKAMTYSGVNFDIVMGASAPVVAWLASTERLSQSILRAWNIVGILMVINVAGRGVLTALQVLPFDSDMKTFAVGTFPYTYIPALLVPLALALHILSLRKLAFAPSNPTRPKLT